MPPKWRGPLQISYARCAFGVGKMDFNVPYGGCAHTREVPPIAKLASPPYFSTISLNLAPDSSKASASVMRTQPGSSSPLGFVRFMQ